ncbi:Serine/threonine-protein kinase tel1 [Exophiala xenobiotica]|uniref:Serine/threonine-protein kinase Tel1 n=1 Tax=Vermiconidia calcicola TaxID=1690605 RepID=A0AAV9Q3Q5_9PEZI|nr:Serine/threonine-protein kinase tel1 [Exophiala xenobiotica]KAK5532373.1 Serine/threonine-protein kinase tel1 [Vermiconidia calcicola]KAK5541911.1 Serine/threonine-protein kinase tel1 [Chaetothyriales sp. CCFEE 6169]KAK5217445.1 Serine/threonine-protein kinase tel1 [Exophiala xenobiotica]KAK5287886.1 Serine/threonine-protein kinase tel1 [Exophiala xenobiotica]
MADVSIIALAIRKLEADTQRARAEGLEDLKRLLGQERVASKFDSVEDDVLDDVFHKIFELIYRIVAKEKPAFVRAAKPTTKNNAASRLEVAAAAFRVTVEAGTSEISFKTALSVLDHIVDTLPLADGSFCQPLKSDYLKSFRTVLEYAPHAEHLRLKRWQGYIDFTLEALSLGLEDESAGDGLASSRDTSMASRSGQPLSSRLSQRSDRSTGRETVSHAEDLAAALRSLTSVTSAPIMSRSAAIAETLLALLKSATRAQEAAFEILNNILFVSLTEDVAFTQKTLSDLIPIMRRLWSSRSSLLREQMLVTLYTCRYFFLSTGDPWLPIEPRLRQSLLNTVLSEYRTKNERDVLSFEDMRPFRGGRNRSLQTEQFIPVRDSARALSGFMTLSVVSCLVLGLSQHTQSTSRQPSDPKEEMPRKRQRIQNVFDETLQIATLGTGLEQLVSVQVLFFLLDQPQPPKDEQLSAISNLMPALSNKNGNVQSWAFLVFSQLLLLKHSAVKRLAIDWVQVCDVAQAALSAPAAVRAACHLLTVILETRILESAMTAASLDNTVFGGPNSGPCAFTDTSLILMTAALRSGLFDDSKRFEAFSLKVISWLTLRWTLPSTLDRLYNAHIAFHGRAELLYTLLASVYGAWDAITLREDWSPAHALWRASLMTAESFDFLRYLLCMPHHEVELGHSAKCDAQQIDPITASRLARAVLSFLNGRLTDFMQSWNSITAERSSNITNDIVMIVGVASTVASGVWTRCGNLIPDSHPETPYSESRNMVEAFISEQSDDSFKVTVARICDSVLHLYDQILQAQEEVTPAAYAPCIESALRLSRLLSGQHTTTQKSKDQLDFDFMDVGEWDSQTNQRSQLGTSSNAIRLDLPLCPDVSTLLARKKLELTTALQVIKSDRTLDPATASTVVDEILSLDSYSLLAARGAIGDFLRLDPGITRTDAFRILSHIGKKFLEKYDFERCESALNFCLTTMHGLARLWTSPEDDDKLSERALDIYDWFLNTALGKHVASPKVLSVMTDLLDLLLREYASFGGEELPSPRTSLLQILNVSKAANKYAVAETLAHIFEKFILSQHDAIFDDIIENLPVDPDNKEGIAVRLHVVATLGARWHTVLRQATYHLFETVANVPSTTPLATMCVAETCKRLDLKQPRELFRLFAPQIFYTWLASGTLSKIPYLPFGYSSLKELALDNLAELVGQIALRGSTHAEELAKLVEQEWKSLLADQFSHAEAYTLSSETTVPKQERLHDGSEKLIRKQIGSDVYLRLLRSNLPNIIARLIISLQDDRGIDKAFEKNDHMTALQIWQEMSTTSNTNAQLPLSQQPSFRARGLFDELNYLYQRLDTQPSQVWTSAMLIHVYRQLLDLAYPVLGSLHICSIVRKIRIAISLAGSVALEGYPLELVLHNLRPYLTLFDCAEDTMGIYRYLLVHGKRYLSANLSFIAGLGVAIFTSLVGFIKSSQDSTTQEVHFVATMNKAQEFRSFLGQYLESIDLADGTEQTKGTFRSLVQHARAIASPGNSSRSSSEGCLLHVLLSDRNTEAPLLTDLHFDLAIGILCENFTPAPEASDDILGHDGDAKQFSPILKTILRRLKLNQSFRIWAAEVIGRGHIMQGLTFNTRSEKSRNYPSDITSVEQDQDAIHSYTSIVEYLQDLVWRSDFSPSTFAERTLQLIFSGLSEKDIDVVFQPKVDRDFIGQLKFKRFPCPAIAYPRFSDNDAAYQLQGHESSCRGHETWATNILGDICEVAARDPVLGFLKPLTHVLPASADILLPYAAHLILLNEANAQPIFKERLSQEFAKLLLPEAKPNQKARQLALKALLYLQRCRYPNEPNLSARYSWLDVDFGDAAVAAADCQMWHEALLLLELHQSQSQLQAGRSSRRSFAMSSAAPSEVISRIYENVDDPDFFYGKQEDFDLAAVIGKMSHEGASQKSLSFHSAMLDSQIKLHSQDQSLAVVAQMTAATLSAANMRGISEAVKQHYDSVGSIASGQNESGLQPGELWDVQPADNRMLSSKSMEFFLRDLHNSSNKESVILEMDRSLLSHVDDIKNQASDKTRTSNVLSQLAALAEVKQILKSKRPEDLEAAWAAIEARDDKVKLAEFERLSPILVGREAAFGAIRRNPNLQATFSLGSKQALLNEIRAARRSLVMASNFDAHQFCLNRTLYLSELNQLALQSELKVDVAIQYDLARTLWSQGETSTSIGILQKLKDRNDAAKQAILITRADILTDLGHKIAEARLEKPDEIISRYLAPSFKELHGRGTGSEAGRVYHNFAAFCDMQLQDPDNLDDFTRISKIRDRKLQEVHDLEQMHKNSPDEKQKKQLWTHLQRAKTWFKIDEEEWQRVQKNRTDLILNCLENYLLSMRASDGYPNDTLRFLALWLNQAESSKANDIVGRHLATVPTIKFAPLVNQLSSRLLDVKDSFQKLLMDLMFRICSDHPYHSLYQLFAASKSKGMKQDEIAVSRNLAAIRLSDMVNKKSVSSAIWVALHNSCIQYHRVATDRLSDKELKTGSKIQLRKLPSGQKLENVLSDAHTRIAPPTLNIPLRTDRDYSQVPTFAKFEPLISIAGGVSAPKIITVIASDGSRHKMLLKGGNDDLRQDAIMEQVFQQVSELLKDHRATRQRNLGIRTYKVIPLTTNTGIIEFVKDTIPLHEYLLPAHARYFPKDYTQMKCRKDIADAQTKPLEQRIRAYRNVVANFHPVMRFFFMENFPDPDDWFYKRLNYSRSTATISILGHVLGLGDRHGHNILLDENSGEVVHIDLGVAFEAGRVLPIPEVVPFRLTRDLVDGMGLTGVEGVFRRCCNFTLEALRREQEAIMTLLDVLRYDPLHSWSISPLRLQKMQENNEEAEAAAGASVVAGVGGAVVPNDMATRRDANEPSEADRALTIVAKKLGKALSVEATVNELIRQAMDERNLAVLYCGWAAYV